MESGAKRGIKRKYREANREHRGVGASFRQMDRATANLGVFMSSVKEWGGETCRGILDESVGNVKAALCTAKQISIITPGKSREERETV